MVVKCIKWELGCGVAESVVGSSCRIWMCGGVVGDVGDVWRWVM